jgi:hypothetical protein
VERPNGNGRNQAHAAGVGGALSVIFLALLDQAGHIHVDQSLAAAITVVVCYLAAFFPKPPSGG